VPLRAAVTAHGRSVLTNYIVALPAYALYRTGLAFDFDNVSAAAGVSDGLSTYTVIATSIPGVTRLELLSAWFNGVLELGGPVGEVEIVDVDGRLVQLYNGARAVAEGRAQETRYARRPPTEGDGLYSASPRKAGNERDDDGVGDDPGLTLGPACSRTCRTPSGFRCGGCGSAHSSRARRRIQRTPQERPRPPTSSGPPPRPRTPG